MDVIESVTNRLGVKIQLGRVYEITLEGGNLLYKYLTVQSINLKDNGLVVKGLLWASGCSQVLSQLPPRINPHPSMLIKTNLEYHVKTEQIIREIDVVGEGEFNSIPQEIRHHSFFATHLKIGRSFKKLPKSVMHPKVSPSRQVGIILRREIMKIIRRRKNFAGSIKIDSQRPEEIVTLFKSAGAVTESKALISMQLTKRKTLDSICGTGWDYSKIPGSDRFHFVKSLAMRYHKHKKTITFNVRYFRSKFPFCNQYRENCLLKELKGSLSENYLQ